MADSYAKINKTLISTQVEDQMMEYILGECNVGDKLPNEFELAKKFDTSRSTIREVMKTIASHGIVEIRHGSGTYVISKSPKIADSDPLHLSGRKDKYRLALELFDVRLMLEPEIAAMAADLRTKEQAKEVLRLCNEVEALYESGADHSKKDAEFHACIAACSGNLVVQSLVPIIQSAIITFCNVTQRKLKNETIITHRAITNAILNKDAIGARCAMITHLSSNRDAILEMIRKREKSSDDF